MLLITYIETFKGWNGCQFVFNPVLFYFHLVLVYVYTGNIQLSIGIRADSTHNVHGREILLSFFHTS